jgi:hypothetical protein
VPPNSGDDLPLPLRELARRAGITEGSLRSWAKRQDRPLRTQRHGPRSVTSTTGELRAFCAAHLDDLPAAKRALAHLDSPTAALDTDSLRKVLEAVIAAVRATTAAHVELAQDATGRAENTAITCRAHATALTNALRGLDDALTRITPATPGPR